MSRLKKPLCCMAAAALLLTGGLPGRAVEPVEQPAPLETEQKKPNIIYIMCDDLSAQVISSMGSRYRDIAPTPNIDRLAREGAIVNNTYCTNAICVPSRANVMTGLPSQQNGVYTLQDVLDPALDTFPKELQKNGYSTAMIGKWHLQSEPQGFDYYHVLVGQGQYGPSNSTPNVKGVPYINSRNNPQWPAYIPPDPETGAPHRYPNPNLDPYAPANSWPEGHVTDSTMFLAMEWLKNENESQRDPNKPFLLMIHNKAPHVPNNGYALRYEDYLKDVELPMPETYDDPKSSRDIASKDFGMIRGQDLETYQEDIKGYLRLVKGIDDALGNLLDYLDLPENKELKENTAVMFTSDQGLFLGEHHYSDKRWIFRESAQMPMLIRYPAEIPGQTQCEDFVTSLDFAPTILDYAGIEKPEQMTGRSFRENLKGSTPPDWKQSAYFRYWANADANVPAHYGIRTEEYLLTLYYGMSLDMLVDEEHINKQTPVGAELYDLKNDPLETTNLYYVPEYQETVRELTALLKERKAEAEGENYDETRYPALAARMAAFEAGAPDPEPGPGVLYVISNTEINTKGTYSQDMLDQKNAVSRKTALEYTETLKKRAAAGIVSIADAPVNQEGQRITGENLAGTTSIGLSVYYDRITDRATDARFYGAFYDVSGRLLGVAEQAASLQKGENLVTLSLDSPVAEEAAQLKVFIWNEQSTPYTPPAGTKTVLEAQGNTAFELPMDYRAAASDGASFTLNQKGSGSLENWTNKADTLTWQVRVPQGKAGRYVVSGKYKAAENSNLVLTNASNGKAMETALRSVSGMYPLNMGILELQEGINTLVLSRNSSGVGNGDAAVDLQPLTLAKVDSEAFPAAPVWAMPKTLLLDQSIRFGTRLFHTGEKTFQWEAAGNGLMWKVRFDQTASFALKSEYICGNKAKDPSFTIKFIDPVTWTVVREIPMEPMDRDTGTEFGQNWDTSSNQTLGIVRELPAGEYILELGKTATEGTVVGTFNMNISFASLGE